LISRSCDDVTDMGYYIGFCCRNSYWRSM